MDLGNVGGRKGRRKNKGQMWGMSQQQRMKGFKKKVMVRVFSCRIASSIFEFLLPLVECFLENIIYYYFNFVIYVYYFKYIN